MRYYGGAIERMKFDFLAKLIGNNLNPCKIYEANVDPNNLPSPNSGQFKEITDQELIDKIKTKDSEGASVETASAEFTTPWYETHSPSDGVMSASLKGNTLVNLINLHNINAFERHEYDIIDDAYIKQIANSSWQSWGTSATNHTLKSNTEYTIIVDVRKNTTNGKLYAIATTVGNNLTVFDGSDILVSPGETGVFKYTRTTRSDFSTISYGIYGTLSSSATTGEIEYRIMILEGDWSNKEIPPYFEGMKSVGEVNRTYKYNTPDAPEMVPSNSNSATVPPGSDTLVANLTGTLEHETLYRATWTVDKDTTAIRFTPYLHNDANNFALFFDGVDAHGHNPPDNAYVKKGTYNFEFRTDKDHNMNKIKFFNLQGSASDHISNFSIKKVVEVTKTFDKYVGKNLFDGKNLSNGYVSDTTGNFHSDNNRRATDYIQIESNTNYFITASSSANWGAWYDINKNFINGINGYTKSHLSPSNAKYIRFTIDNVADLSKTQLEKGTVATPYEAYYEGCKIGIESINENLWNGEFESGRWTLRDGSAFVDFTTIRTKTRIKVKPNTNYSLKTFPNMGVYNISEYNINGEFVNTITGSNIMYELKFTTQQTTKYINVSFHGTDLNNKFILIESNIIPTSYIEPKIDKTEILTREPLRRVNTISDYVNSATKVWKNISQIVLGETPVRISFHGYNPGNIITHSQFRLHVHGRKLSHNTFCNRLPKGSLAYEGKDSYALNNDRILTYLGVIYFEISNATIGVASTDSEEAKINAVQKYLKQEYLKGNPYIFVYEKVSPNYQSPLSFIKVLPTGIHDIVYEDNGHYYIKEYIKKSIIRESDIVTTPYNQQEVTYYYLNSSFSADIVSITDSTGAKYLYSDSYVGELNHYSNLYRTRNNNISYGQSSKRIFFTFGKNTSLNSAKSALVGKEIWYQLATPIVRELTEDEKAEYLLKKPYLKNTLNLKSYKNGSIQIDSGKISPTTKITYTIDIKDVKILTRSCHEVGKSKSLLVEVSLEYLKNSLYGGNNSTLKSALEEIKYLGYSSNCKAMLYNATRRDGNWKTGWISVDYPSYTTNDWIVQYGNTIEKKIIKTISASNAQYCLTDDSKIYILLVSSNIATDSTASIINLDYTNIDIGITRANDVITPIDTELTDTWSVILKGICHAYVKDEHSKANKVFFDISDDTTNNRLVCYMPIPHDNILVSLVAKGIHNNLHITTPDYKKFEGFNLLIQQQNSKITMYLLNYDKTLTHTELQLTEILKGPLKLRIGQNLGSSEQGSIFLDGCHVINKAFTEDEVEVILKSHYTGQDSNLQKLAKVFQNPNLVPKFDNSAWNLKRSGLVTDNGLTVETTLIAENDYLGDIRFPIMPNTKYELTGLVEADYDFSGVVVILRNTSYVLDITYGALRNNKPSYVFTTPTDANDCNLILSGASGSAKGQHYKVSNLQLRRVDY